MSYSILSEIQSYLEKGDYDIVPIYKKFPAKDLTPMNILKELKGNNQECYLLESADHQKRWSRYSFLGYNPVMSIACYDHQIIVGQEKYRVNHPHDYIRNLLSHYKTPFIPSLPPFTGGLVGFFGYEYFHYNEPTLKRDKDDNEKIPDMYLMLFDTVICFDHQEHMIQLVTHVPIQNLEVEYQKGMQKLEELHCMIQQNQKSLIPALQIKEPCLSLFSKEKYCEIVEQAKKHIYEGDIFQIVLSNRWEIEAKGSLIQIYENLRETNPSPYMFYLSTEDLEIVGASPETLVKLDDNKLYTYPLAGTRPRGKTIEEDKQNETDLLNDQKELAEHNMLVDLGRNDIGKISQFKSVRVEEYLSILKYSHVMHIGSTVSGKILPDKDAIDAIDALLPAGTLSGAPKIKASSLIYELEGHKRYLYGGAIGYIGFSGQMDTCIAIRFAYKTKNKVYVSSGAGIVADSQPEKEFQECCQKAAAIMDALKCSQGGKL